MHNEYREFAFNIGKKKCNKNCNRFYDKGVEDSTYSEQNLA